MPDPKDESPLARAAARFDPIAPLPRATLELYRDSLREVRFPDLDFDSLSHTAAELCAAQLEVECIEAALLSARDAVRERAELLNSQSERALSYARIFAVGNPALSQRVAEVEALAKGGVEAPRAPGKKRGRPRKANTGAELFGEERSETEAETEADEAAA
jgi:hypothetical protein